MPEVSILTAAKGACAGQGVLPSWLDEVEFNLSVNDELFQDDASSSYKLVHNPNPGLSYLVLSLEFLMLYTNHLIYSFSVECH